MHLGVPILWYWCTRDCAHRALVLAAWYARITLSMAARSRLVVAKPDRKRGTGSSSGRMIGYTARCRRYVGLADALVSTAAASGLVEGCGYPHQVGERLDLHLPHNPAAMGLHRDLADSELCRDLFVRPTGDHQSHDLPFARS